MRVLQVGLLDEHGTVITTLRGSQWVKLSYRFETLQYIFSPFLSFILIDKNGNRILGASSVTEDVQFGSLEQGMKATVTFSFEMPELANDEYLISVGLNDGTQAEHVRHQYIVDAYKIRFASDSLKQKQATLVKLPKAVIALECE